MTISKQLTIMELWSIIPLRSDNTNANRIIVCQLTIPGTKVKEERREPLVEIRDGYLESSPRIFPFVSSGSMKLKCTSNLFYYKYILQGDESVCEDMFQFINSILIY
uniref:Uncharacterized protein n=1 Tax=Lepeophtheirus salmonis TaxID=72036 RepID=A0A0K2V356_LEPSM